MTMLAVRESVLACSEETTRAAPKAQTRATELSVTCEKCGDTIEVEYRYISELNAIIIEPRQDVTTVVIHKAHESKSAMKCDGHMFLLGKVRRLVTFAQECTLPRDPADDTLYALQERIMSLYRDGHEIEEICALCDVRERAIKQALDRKSIRMRHAYKRILELRRRDLKTLEIAKKLEVSTRQVQSIMAKYSASTVSDKATRHTNRHLVDEV